MDFMKSLKKKNRGDCRNSHDGGIGFVDERIGGS